MRALAHPVTAQCVEQDVHPVRDRGADADEHADEEQTPSPNPLCERSHETPSDRRRRAGPTFTAATSWSRGEAADRGGRELEAGCENDPRADFAG